MIAKKKVDYELRLVLSSVRNFLEPALVCKNNQHILQSHDKLIAKR